MFSGKNIWTNIADTSISAILSPHYFICSAP